MKKKCEHCKKETANKEEYRLPFGSYYLCSKCADLPMGEIRDYKKWNKQSLKDDRK